MNHGKNHLLIMGVGFVALLILSKFVGVSVFLLFFFLCFFMMAAMMLGMGHGDTDHKDKGHKHE